MSSSLIEFTYATDTKTLTLNPGTLYYNASYTIKLLEGLSNKITKQKVASLSYYFETRDESHFTATAVLADESNIDGLSILIPTIKIDFKQPVMNISLAEKALEFYRGDTLMTGYKRRWSNDLSKLEIYYTATLVPDAEHTLKMVNSIKDAQGRIIEPFADLTIRTMPNITPTLVTPSTTGAPVDTDLVVKFSNSISWEEADDASKITVTLVALGGSRNLWLGFDSKHAESYMDHKPVIDKELHAVLGVSVGTLVNTGRAKANPVVVYDGPKPEGFDFQTCSFVLGAMFKDDQKGIYENDYYHIHIATAGQDPHGIVIPGKWQWPTEETCIKDAYPEFTTWANDHTKYQDWYKHPVEGKVVKR